MEVQCREVWDSLDRDLRYNGRFSACVRALNKFAYYDPAHGHPWNGRRCSVPSTYIAPGKKSEPGPVCSSNPQREGALRLGHTPVERPCKTDKIPRSPVSCSHVLVPENEFSMRLRQMECEGSCIQGGIPTATSNVERLHLLLFIQRRHKETQTRVPLQGYRTNIRDNPCLSQPRRRLCFYDSSGGNST